MRTPQELERLREQAVMLRRQGKSRTQIKEILGFISEQVRFVNSDPALIRFFLNFLAKVGVPRESLRFCVHIHESADVEAATRYWASVTAATQFARPVIKHHTPRTSGPGDNTDYHGCLKVTVAKSSALYREISGWAHGVMTAKRLGTD